mmetsp:Transcript_6385/g.10462  ORF Transcript_6385/g.10462 Transcript_6385/m.10462 type:complete len:375 (+) Transcript_6385:120-1244(+)|eukprot:CAMPEP_0114432544 /NCGR_PEP_ID=MMETSP0103-20121206/11211_1 /TAXON_ID=37642 ORGANISM="Paraphysomonas imperforata, Strain PA2" /NCGR_SAMPLE_ID=MMETSP0103 /ASSEMBLY_ACC=CAM_ASM_000201 /LENGTH=374 /DNA_ID=CAMNT_0001602225 /DNA_START=49 /DNA_END=1173 /DNA_ORIENTATION=+
MLPVRHSWHCSGGTTALLKLARRVPQARTTVVKRSFRATVSLAKEDYYKTLGVPKTASKSEIKKKYFELAKKYHPDVNKDEGAKEKFSEYSEAYEVLSDEEKKQAYDTYGHAGVDGQQGAGGFGGFQGGFGGPFGGFHQGGQQVDAEELFDMFEGMFGGQAARGRGRDVQQHCSLSFLEAVNGCEKEIHVQYTDRTAPNQKKTKVVKVNIPAGVDDGVLIRVSGEGGGGMKGKPSGDLRLHINVQKDAYFSRDGPNVHVDKPLSITRAILGGTVDVLTLGGMVEVRVPPGTQPGAKLVLRGKGIKDVNSIYKGDQYIHLKVRIPKTINDRQKELLKEFEAEFEEAEEGKGDKKKEEDDSCTASAWQRLKDFMKK